MDWINQGVFWVKYWVYIFFERLVIVNFFNVFEFLLKNEIDYYILDCFQQEVIFVVLKVDKIILICRFLLDLIGFLFIDVEVVEFLVDESDIVVDKVID